MATEQTPTAKVQTRILGFLGLLVREAMVLTLRRKLAPAS
jgi:hypothetical protein